MSADTSMRSNHCLTYLNSLVMAGFLIFTSIVLLIWTVPYALKFFAFTISGVGYGE